MSQPFVHFTVINWMMLALFTVFGEKSPLSEALVFEFSKIATTGQATSVHELQAQNAANVIVLNHFHIESVPTIGKTILNVIAVSSTDQIAPQSFTYFVHEQSDPTEAAQEIVKRFVGFESRRSCVVTPFSLPLANNLSVILVNKAAPPEIVQPVVHSPSSVATPAPQPVLQKTEARKLRSLPKIKKTSLTIPRLTLHIKKRQLGLFIAAAIWLISLPFVLLLLSASCAFGAYKLLPVKSEALVGGLLHCSMTTAHAAQTLSSALSLTAPLEFSSFVFDASEIALEFHGIYTGIASDNLIDSLKSIAPTISHVARQVSVLTTHPEELSFIKTHSSGLYTLLTHSPMLNVVSTAASRSEILLGKQKPQTYVILLQNNMELRPTGGFIGSFLLVDIDNGKVTQKKIYDVYDADGQLSGYVKPPEAISRYLGEASWHMRDSNWDPDFAISAKRAIWFLDKSINRQVDGVIGVNLEVLRSFIKALGPIRVPDYGGELTADNFYATIQGEVHKEFFPGSRKKSNYLTAVFNAVFTKLSEQGSSNIIPLMSGLLSNLDSRDIQIYMNDETMQTELSKAGIAGDVTINSLGFIEANVGVNKANQYIERVGEWHFNKGAEDTTVTGQLQLTNTAASQSDETRYRVYVRAIAPKASELKNVKVTVAGVQRAIIPETQLLENRVEDGFFFELKGGERALVTCSWTIPTSTDISLWKQGGVASYPLSILTLTSEGKTKYNTAFDHDIRIQL